MSVGISLANKRREEEARQRNLVSQQFGSVESQLGQARGQISSQQELIQQRRIDLLEAQQQAQAFRLPQRTIAQQFSLGSSAFGIERQVERVKMQRGQALSQISFAGGQLTQAEKELESQRIGLESQASVIAGQKQQALRGINVSPLSITLRGNASTPEGAFGSGKGGGFLFPTPTGLQEFVPVQSLKTGDTLFVSNVGQFNAPKIKDTPKFEFQQLSLKSAGLSPQKNNFNLNVGASIVSNLIDKSPRTKEKIEQFFTKSFKNNFNLNAGGIIVSNLVDKSPKTKEKIEQFFTKLFPEAEPTRQSIDFRVIGIAGASIFSNLIDKSPKTKEKLGQFFTKSFPEAEPTRQSIDIFGQEKAERIATDVRAIGIAGALSLAGVPKIPKSATFNLRQVAPPEINVMTGTKIVKGEPQQVGIFSVKQEVAPPKVKINILQGNKGFLDSEQSINFIKPKFEFTQTPLQFSESPTLAFTSKTGKTAKLDILTGQSGKIDLKNIKELTKTQKFLFKKLRESKDGLLKSDEFSIGFIEQTKTAKGLRRGKVSLEDISDQALSLSVRGKSIKRFEQVARTRKILDTPTIERFELELLTKDVTKSTARASGNLSRIKGFITKFKIPLRNVDEVTTSSNLIRSSGSKKTPFSVTFGKQEQILKQVTPILPKFIPKATRTLKILDKSKSYASQIAPKVTTASRSANLGRTSIISMGIGSGFRTQEFDFLGSNAFPPELRNRNVGFKTLSFPRETSILTSATSQGVITSSLQFNRLANIQVPKSVTIPRSVSRSFIIEAQSFIQPPRNTFRQPPITTNRGRFFRTPRPPRNPRITRGGGIFPIKGQFNLKRGASSRIFGIGQPTKFIPSVVGAVRFNVLGERITKKKARSIRGLPVIRGVLE